MKIWATWRHGKEYQEELIQFFATKELATQAWSYHMADGITELTVHEVCPYSKEEIDRAAESFDRQARLWGWGKYRKQYVQEEVNRLESELVRKKQELERVKQ